MLSSSAVEFVLNWPDEDAADDESEWPTTLPLTASFGCMQIYKRKGRRIGL
jgi:hypothetical protein